MKKIPALLLAASLALTMAACGGEAAPAGNDTAEGGAPGIEAEAAAEYPVTLDNGKTITINGAADAAISALGEHIDFMEAPSCVHDGNDKVYTYDGCTVTTSPDAGGNQYVAELSLISDVVALDNGLYIGCTLAEAKKAFGEEFTESFGVLKYELPGVTISVVAEGDTVTGITFASAAAH